MWYVAGEIALLLVLALLLGLLVGWLLWGRKRHDDEDRVQPRPVTRSREQPVSARPATTADRGSAVDRRRSFDPPERPRATAAPITDATGDDATVVILRGDGGLSAAPASNDDPTDTGTTNTDRTNTDRANDDPDVTPA